MDQRRLLRALGCAPAFPIRRRGVRSTYGDLSHCAMRTERLLETGLAASGYGRGLNAQTCTGASDVIRQPHCPNALAAPACRWGCPDVIPWLCKNSKIRTQRRMI